MEVRFTAALWLDYYLSRHDLTREDLGVAPTLVVTWFPELAEHLARQAGASRCEHWPYGRRQLHLYRGEVDGVPVGFQTLPVGSPGTVALLEELLAAGARRFIGLGLAGSLQPIAPIGSFLLPGNCIAEEGTSAHYLADRSAIGPHPGLAAALEAAVIAAGLEAHSGRHWTTDAPYREFVPKIEQYGEEGVFGVDMETSAMYALGRFRQVPVANLLVVSDELWREWNPAFGTSELGAAMRQAADAVLAGIPALAAVTGLDGD